MANKKYPGYRLTAGKDPLFKMILFGRRQEWIGRVTRHMAGGFVAVVDKLSARSDTEVGAFSEVITQHRELLRQKSRRALVVQGRTAAVHATRVIRSYTGELPVPNTPLEVVQGLPPTRRRSLDQEEVR